MKAIGTYPHQIDATAAENSMQFVEEEKKKVNISTN